MTIRLAWPDGRALFDQAAILVYMLELFDNVFVESMQMRRQLQAS